MASATGRFIPLRGNERICRNGYVEATMKIVNLILYAFAICVIANMAATLFVHLIWKP